MSAADGSLEDTQPHVPTQAEVRRPHRARAIPDNAREVLEALTDGCEDTLRDVFEVLHALVREDSDAAVDAVWRIISREKALWKAGMYAQAAQWNEVKRELQAYNTEQRKQERTSKGGF